MAFSLTHRQPVPAGAALPRLRPANNYLGALGHSMLDQANGNFGVSPSIDTQFTIGSFPWWVNFLSKGQFVVDRQSWLGAVSGTTTQQMCNSSQIQNAVNCRASIIFLLCSTNDRANNFTLDDGTVAVLGSAGTVTIPNVKALINALVGAGKIVVLLSDPPRGSSTYTAQRLTGTQLTYHVAFRDWVRNVAPSLWPGDVFAVDTWPDGENTVSGTLGDVRDNYTRDGLHPGTVFAKPVAQRVLGVVQGLGVPVRNVPVLGAIDAFDAVNSPTGAVAPSTRIAGNGTSAGSLPGNQGGVTYAGNRPTSYGLTSNSSAQAGTLTVTGGRNATSTQQGGQADWYSLAISGTTASNTSPIIQLSYTLSAGDKANLAAGDKITIFDEFEIDSGATGLRGIDFKLIRTTPTLTETIRTGNVDNTMGVLDTIVSTAGMSGYHDGGGLYATIDGTETDISLYWTWLLAESATISVTSRIRKPAVRKVLS